MKTERNGTTAEEIRRRVIGRIAVGHTEWPVLNRLRSGPDAPVHTHILLNSMGGEYRLERTGANWMMSGKHLAPQAVPNHTLTVLS